MGYVVACFGEKQTYGLLSFCIFTFAEVLEPEVSVGVEDVFCRPISVVEVAPCGVVVVLDYEPSQVVFFGGIANFCDLLLKLKLWSVNSQYS